MPLVSTPTTRSAAVLVYGEGWRLTGGHVPMPAGPSLKDVSSTHAVLPPPFAYKPSRQGRGGFMQSLCWFGKRAERSHLRDVIITGLLTGAAIGLILELLLTAFVPATSQIDLMVSLAHHLFPQPM